MAFSRGVTTRGELDRVSFDFYSHLPQRLIQGVGSGEKGFTFDILDCCCSLVTSLEGLKCTDLFGDREVVPGDFNSLTIFVCTDESFARSKFP